MRIRVEDRALSVDAQSGAYDAIVVNLFSETTGDAAVLARLDDGTRAAVEAVRAAGTASKTYESESVLLTDSAVSKRVYVIGAGKTDDFDVMTARRLAGTAARALRKKGAKRLAFVFQPGTVEPAAAAQAFAEGVVLSTFEINVYSTSTKEERVLDEVAFYLDGGDGVKEAALRGQVIAEAENFARYLANEPANEMYPERLAEEARKMSEQYGLEFDALDNARLKELGAKALLAVNSGSAREARMIVLTYNGGKLGDPAIGLVGKGICFDSGGISIKPAEKMGDMKQDMSGGAWVIGIMRILAQLKPAINVIGIVPATENMPSGSAYRPGDVVGSLEGKTIEVDNTDAEGRVVLSDGLAYARKLGANRLVDLATLTGAIVVALGTNVTGVFGTPQTNVDRFIGAATTAGERAWQMPLFPEYLDQIRSTIGDLVNTGGRAGGAATAAAFLREFTGGVPWLHLDIAGTAYTDNEKPYAAKGSSGQIMRTVVDYVFAEATRDPKGENV